MSQSSTIDGVQLTPLRIIRSDAGSVMHARRSTDPDFIAFGEAYFSTILPGARKGWKRHRRMTLQLVVPVGKIGFVLYDSRENSMTPGELMQVELGTDNYQRLAVPPGIWMAFYGAGSTESMLLNIADIPHDPLEADSLPLHDPSIPFQWP